MKRYFFVVIGGLISISGISQLIIKNFDQLIIYIIGAVLCFGIDEIIDELKKINHDIK